MIDRIRPLFWMLLILLTACAPEVPENQPIERAVWLDQNWTQAESQYYHHWSQGTKTLLIPYEWFVALEQPNLSLFEQPLLKDTEYLRRFGWIPGDVNQHNPDGLPIGFARDSDFVNPISGKKEDVIGLTCSGCHTGHLEFRGTDIRIDGSGAMVNVVKFLESLGFALVYTKFIPGRFGRFAERVLGENHTDAQADQLKDQLKSVLKEFQKLQKLEKQHEDQSIEEGFGRTDALARIGNEVFGIQMDKPENFAATDAPVNFPHIWSTSWFDWVQYNGSIEQPMVRNAGEALGVIAKANFRGPGTMLFRTSADLKALFGIEKLLAGKTPPTEVRRFTGLNAPKWPEDILGKIDHELAAKGAALYKENCQSCHRPVIETEAFWDSTYWTQPNNAGEQYFKVEMVDVDYVGTDPMQAYNLRHRKVDVAPFLGLTSVVYGEALGQIVEKVVQKYFDDQNFDAVTRERWNGHRPNGIRAPMQYKARPLNGIWATPPFLHNGSVPNLFALLSPLDERPEIFYLGSRQFDPKHVGYEYGELDGGTKINTAVKGNWNKGHEFNDGEPGNGIIGRKLTVAERWALVEYLKTL